MKEKVYVKLNQNILDRLEKTIGSYEYEHENIPIGVKNIIENLLVNEDVNAERYEDRENELLKIIRKFEEENGK